MQLSLYLLFFSVCFSVTQGQQADLPAKCAGIQCSPPNCLDSYIPEGGCCPTCPGPGRSCTYLGKTYQDNERFRHECNRCKCNDGQVGCTKRKCSGSKPGRCPRPKGVGICVDLCSDDYSCPRRQKCCSNGCGKTCQRPRKKPGKQCTYKGVTYQDGETFDDECNTCDCDNGNVACTEMLCPGKPGRCPKPVGGGICIDTCSSDYKCPGDEKCCSNGCGSLCMKPISIGIPCVHKEAVYRDGQTFDDECNTCTCNNGTAGCTLMACPGNPGRCPQRVGGVGSCTSSCTSDYDCLPTEKCCSNDYCQTCMKPIDVGLPCDYKRNTYQDGQTFDDECNTCTCKNGVAGCTKMACPGNPGTCPKPLGGVGICVDSCLSDYECLQSEKCCSNGYCQICMKSIDVGVPCPYKGNSYADGETFKDECNTCKCRNGVAGCTRMACPGNPGTCPKPVGGVGICVDSCLSDYECLQSEKCCSNGYCQICMKSIDVGVPCSYKGNSYIEGETFMDECNTCTCRNGVAGCTRMACPGRPGNCPRPIGGVGGAGACLDGCNSDYECPSGEKCCSNGYCLSCMVPIDVGIPCMRKGISYQDGETFKDDCNTCTCRNGVAGCTKMTCPGRPGNCPRPVGGVGSGTVCLDGCFSDYECPSGEKCCSNGYCLSCTVPIDVGIPCMRKGISYQDGETFKDDCNTCTCRNGVAGCTKMACPGRPGNCPRPVGVVGGAGACLDGCTSDYECPSGEKCCSNGYCHSCMAPIDVGVPCMYQGFSYQDGEIFKDDCNTCTCRNGVAKCTRMACPGRPGNCPRPVGVIGGTGLCLDGCTSDYECPSGEKCCSNKYCLSCMVPTDVGIPCMHKGISHKDGETFKDDCNTCSCRNGVAKCTQMACPGRPGNCPRPVGVVGGTGLCLDGCTSDYECPSGEKCCSNGYCLSCMVPTDVGVPCMHLGISYPDGETFKDDCNTCTCRNGVARCTQMTCPGRPGNCPRPVGVGGTGACLDGCNSDYECPSGEKCCSNGYCLSCMVPSDVGVPCLHLGVSYPDGETFKEDCNTCTCRNGVARCTQMTCPGRPGNCPRPIGVGGTGACLDGCNSDYECPSGEKCCSNGYCLSCMVPSDVGVPCLHLGVSYPDGETFKEDCNTCTCRNGVARCTQMTCPGRPGNCPRPIGVGGTGACLDGCNSDYECPSGEKCCSNGYCLSCMVPSDVGVPCLHLGVSYPDGETFKEDCNTCTCRNGVARCTQMTCPGRPGNCPRPIGVGGTGACLDGCNSDYECPSGEKCCSNGYCLSCMVPSDVGVPCLHLGVSYPDGETFKEDCNTCTCRNGVARCTQMTCPGRPGNCPRPIGVGGTGACLDGCNSDYECPSGEKCCSNGYCLSCMVPSDVGVPCLHLGVSYPDGETFKEDCNTCTCRNGVARCTQMTCPGRPGNCPRPIGVGGTGACLDGCNSDYECPSGEKCCSNGYCLSCMVPSDVGVPCLHLGVSYPDGETFKEDCNTCTCRNGVARCTQMTCPGRPGNCPRPVGGVGSGTVCLDRCNSDYECPSGEKCCSNGYCLSCMVPSDVGIPCDHNGILYIDGETFKDECNTCTCSNGFAACTLMACPDVKPGNCPPPMSVGICVDRCTTDLSCPDQEKCCSNGCGTLCLPPTNGGKPCYHNGRTYNDGENFKNDCNTCTCTDGRAACTLMACPGKPCVYNGISYQDGEQFRQDCNTCTCSNGQAACTLKACYDEKPGQCPPAAGGGNCVHRCTTDLSCPNEEKCCSNGCGTLCMVPVSGGGTCYHEGVTYKDGETFMDDCNTCRCSAGSAICTLKSCQIEKSGRCPASIGNGTYCVNECRVDSDCLGIRKCCSNGCGRVCMIPEDAGRPCIQHGQIYQHGESFKDECNSCTCTDGTPACTLMACPPKRPCYYNGVIRADGDSFKDDCNTCVCADGRVLCTLIACGQTCSYRGSTYQDGASFKDDCNTCHCHNGNVTCTRLDCSGTKPGTCPRSTPFQRCGYTRCYNDRSCPGNEKCCSAWCGYTCMEPVGGDTCAGVVCPAVVCAEHYTSYTPPGQCCPICRPPIGEKPGSCPRRSRGQVCFDLCTTDFSCPGQQKCCTHRCGKSCERPRGGRCEGVTCPPLRCLRQFRPPGQCCAVCRRGRGRGRGRGRV